MTESHQPHSKASQPWQNWILAGFLAVAAFFLLTEHTGRQPKTSMM